MSPLKFRADLRVYLVTVKPLQQKNEFKEKNKVCKKYNKKDYTHKT